MNILKKLVNISGVFGLLGAGVGICEGAVANYQLYKAGEYHCFFDNKRKYVGYLTCGANAVFWTAWCGCVFGFFNLWFWPITTPLYLSYRTTGYYVGYDHYKKKLYIANKKNRY